MTWHVWLQADNGNRFPVGSFHSRDSAEHRSAELTQGHHKQTYRVNESPDLSGAEAP